MQYEGPTSSVLKVTAKVKVFQKMVILQGHRVKIMVPREGSCHKEYKCAI